MPRGSILLGEIAPHLTHLDVACNRCDRKGRLDPARLLAEHGATMPIPVLLGLLSADCSKRTTGRAHDVCGIHLPQLPTLFR